MPVVDLQVATQQALFHLNTKVIGNNGVVGFSEWAGAQLAQPIVAYDVQYGSANDPILYIFPAQLQNQAVGFIAINASTAIGTTLSFIRSSAGIDVYAKYSQLSALLRSMNASGFIDVNLVVYSFPKLGVSGRRQNGSVFLKDLFTGTTLLDGPVPNEPADAQGLSVWSFWDNFPQGGDPHAAWNIESQQIAALSPSPVTVLRHALSRQVRIMEAFDISINNRPPTISQSVLPVPVKGQETDVYCAPTCLQEMYKYVYQRDIIQNEIATAMQITVLGSTLSGQLNAYRNYFGADFTVSLDRNPTGDKALASLINNIPIKCGIEGHARLLVGFRKETYVDPITGNVGLEETSAMVNDPEPVGVGSIIWENTKLNNWKDFIGLTRKVTT